MSTLLTIKLRNILPHDIIKTKSINRFKAARSIHRRKIHETQQAKWTFWLNRPYTWDCCKQEMFPSTILELPCFWPLSETGYLAKWIFDLIQHSLFLNQLWLLKNWHYYFGLIANKRGVTYSILERSMSKGTQIYISLHFFIKHLLCKNIPQRKQPVIFLVMNGGQVSFSTALKTLSSFFMEKLGITLKATTVRYVKVKEKEKKRF